MSSARKWKLGSGDRPFRQYTMAEPEQLGRAADGIGGDCASFLNELLLLDQAAKILLVHQPACKRFNTALQLQQGEFRRHQFEYHGTVFDLGAQPRDSGCENAAVISTHRPGRDDRRRAFPLTDRLRDPNRLVERLLALQHQLLVPFALVEAKR